MHQECPADPLVALSLHLRNPQQSRLNAHLEQCENCRDRLQRLQRDERLIAELRGGAALDESSRARIHSICKSAWSG